jgi:hypothetical protein
MSYNADRKSLVIDEAEVEVAWAYSSTIYTSLYRGALKY